MRLISSFLFAVALGLAPIAAGAQLQCITNASFSQSAYASLYDMMADGNPVVIAVGNVHSQSSEQLLASGVIQDLTHRHDVDGSGNQFSSKDLRVAFIDVQVMASEANGHLAKGIRVIQMNEEDPALNGAGWEAVYSINNTGLFLVTPDHLVRKLSGKTADEVYAEVKLYNNKIRPSVTPDIRLLDATTGAAGEVAQIRVQNFSTTPAKKIAISVLKDGQEIANTVYEGAIASLEDAVIPVTLPSIAGNNLTIIAKIDGDANQTNNRWTGPLRGGLNTVAGNFSR